MWPKRRRTKPSTAPSDRVRRAEEAASKAEDELRQVQKQRSEVDRLAASIQGFVKRNHFGERFELEIKRRASSP
ncbi:DUF7620 family protein [Nocardia nova]|uniref:DUF7620 family protein n=1 Tax=Nocardia nova TaxID=37330 RepID=UPI003F7450C3